MIEIFVNGISLDLDPSGKFELDIEQPLLDSDHLPVPYSTSIPFLTTPKNCSIFKYVSAMAFLPEVRTVDAEIHLGGILFASGSLIFDGIESGTLNYNFVGKNLDDDLSADTSNTFADKILAYPETLQEYKQAQGGNAEFITAPPLINKSAVSDFVYDADSPELPEPVENSVKYHNWPFDAYNIFTPVISVRELIIRWFHRNIIISEEIDRILKYVYVIGLYKTQPSSTSKGFPGLYIDILDTLPKSTQAEFVKNILKMFCAAIYRDDDKYLMLPSTYVLDCHDSMSLDDKVSRDLDISIENAQGYIFGYENDTSNDTYDTGKLSKDDSGDDAIIEVDEYSDILTASNTQDYSAFKHKSTGDLFTAKKVTVYAYTKSICLTDLIYQNISPATHGENIDYYDNSVGFSLVRCIPEKFLSSYSYQSFAAICPIIEPAAIGSERSNNIYIGLVMNGQMCDHGVTIKTDYFISNNDIAYSDIDSGISLRPDRLFSDYHRTFASWMASDRLVIKTDLNFNIHDMMQVRMYKTVYFHGRYWLIKKLSIRIDIGSEVPEISGEFISL